MSRIHRYVVRGADRLHVMLMEHAVRDDFASEGGVPPTSVLVQDQLGIGSVSTVPVGPAILTFHMLMQDEVRA